MTVAAMRWSVAFTLALAATTPPTASRPLGRGWPHDLEGWHNPGLAGF